MKRIKYPPRPRSIVDRHLERARDEREVLLRLREELQRRRRLRFARAVVVVVVIVAVGSVLAATSFLAFHLAHW